MSDLGLHWVPRSHKKDARLIRVNFTVLHEERHKFMFVVVQYYLVLSKTSLFNASYFDIATLYDIWFGVSF